MAKRIERDGKVYRVRRGVEVEVPPAWVGKVTSRQTIAKRASKLPPKQRKPPRASRRAKRDAAPADD